MKTIILFLLFAYFATDIFNSASNDAILIFLGLFILSFVNELKE